MKKKRRGSKFNRYSKRGLIIVSVCFFIGIVTLNSYEATLNIKSEKVEKEINTLESDIDGLDMRMLELTSFSRLENITKKRGYIYRQNIATAALIGVPKK